MKPRHRRAMMIVGGLAVVAVAAALVLSAFRQNLVFFFTPTQIASNEAPVNKSFRVGGLVEPGSVKRLPDGVTVQFVVTDTAKSIPVAYRGALPDLFREGQGVIAEGALEPNGAFKADAVLAKHDERYMPKEVADALKRSGHWKEGEQK